MIIDGCVQAMRGLPFGYAEVASGAPGAGSITTAPGRLFSVVVLTTGSAALTIYDNASAASGTRLLVIPANAAAGQAYLYQSVPVSNGIYVGGAANTPSVGVSYN